MRRGLFAISMVTTVALAVAVSLIARSVIGTLGVESTTPIEWVPKSFASGSQAVGRSVQPRLSLDRRSSPPEAD